MDEIDLAMRMRQAKPRGAVIPVSDPSTSVPVELRGLTAIASEAGTIDASIAGKDVKNALEAMDDFEVMDSAVTMAEKEGKTKLKFRYGRNNTAEIEAGAKGVTKASRKTDKGTRPETFGKVQSRSQKNNSRAQCPQTSTGHNIDTEEYSGRGYASDSEIRPPIQPKSELRTASYVATTAQEDATQNRNTMSSDDFNMQDIVQRDLEKERLSSSLEHDPPSSKEDSDSRVSATFSRASAMPAYSNLRTKSNPELAAQLIARALRVDFVYFMRLTPITAKYPNMTPYENAEVNLQLLGSYGLPFAEMAFSPFLHLEALRSELGMTYTNDLGDGNESDDSLIKAKDFYRLGLVIPVWREYPRLSVASSTNSMKAIAGSSHGSTGGRRSSIGTSTTMSSLRESCKKGVVVGVFSKRGERRTFSRVEREYLKQWVSLRDHL
jgi:hypothetical protein